jgi:ABC-type antimicrobial peptide transport system permease subunit
MKGREYMKLIKNFIKLSIVGNVKSYFKAFGAVLITTVILTICNNIINNLKMGNMELLSSLRYLNFKYSSIQLTLCILGGIFILNQYYRIMKTNIKNYSIIKVLGASRNQMRVLIYLQSLLLFAVTVPFGLFAGISLSNYILKTLYRLIFQGFDYYTMDSSLEILFLSGMISFAVMVFGVITEMGMKRKWPSQIST